MTCDVGECELQDYAYEYGVKEGSYKGRRKNYARWNPVMERDQSKCILCGKCKVCKEIHKSCIDFSGRVLIKNCHRLDAP